MRWVKRFFSDLVGAYADGFRFAAGLPLLFAAMVALEFGQHAIEFHIGFFDSEAAGRAVALDSSRMILGWIKMILVYVGGFFAIRYLVWGNRARALTVTREAIIRYMPYIAYSLVMFALVFYARSFVAEDRVMAFRSVFGLAQIAIEPLLMLWIVSAATGGVVRGPLESAKRTGWLYFWALGLFFIGRIPINAAHQLLNRYAVGQSPSVMWAMLALDALVVGLLIAIVPALYVRISRFVIGTEDRDEVPTTRTASV